VGYKEGYAEEYTEDGDPRDPKDPRDPAFGGPITCYEIGLGESEAASVVGMGVAGLSSHPRPPESSAPAIVPAATATLDASPTPPLAAPTTSPATPGAIASLAAPSKSSVTPGAVATHGAPAISSETSTGAPSVGFRCPANTAPTVNPALAASSSRSEAASTKILFTSEPSLPSRTATASRSVSSAGVAPAASTIHVNAPLSAKPSIAAPMKVIGRAGPASTQTMAAPLRVVGRAQGHVTSNVVVGQGGGCCIPRGDQRVREERGHIEASTWDGAIAAQGSLLGFRGRGRRGARGKHWQGHACRLLLCVHVSGCGRV